MANIDVSNYLNWEKIVTPSGHVYYIVPDSGLVYDPFLSASKGYSVFWQNPKPTLDEKKAEEDRINKQQKLAEDQASPMGQYGPILAGAGAVVGGKLVTDKLSAPKASTIITSGKYKDKIMLDNGLIKDPSTGEIVGSTTTSGGGVAEVNTSAPPADGSATQQAFTQGATGAQPEIPAGMPGAAPDPSQGVMQMADGSVKMPDGSIVMETGAVQMPDGTVVHNGEVVQGGKPVEDDLTANKYLQGAAAVLGAYNAYEEWKRGDKGSAALSAGSAGVAGANAAGYATGNAAGWLGGAKDIYDLTSNWNDIPDSEKATRAQQQFALAAATYFTGGLAGPLVNAFKSTGLGKSVDKELTKWDQKFNPVSIALNHKSTKEYQQERWQEQVEKGNVTPEQAMMWFEGTPGQEQTKEDRTGEQIFEQAKQDGKQIWGTIGFFDTFGKDWLGGKFNEAQREEIARRVAQEGIVKSDKGDWFITDQERAKAIGDEVLEGQASAVSAAPQRSSTSSPGIGMDGRPLPTHERIGKQLAQRMNNRNDFMRVPK